MGRDDDDLAFRHFANQAPDLLFLVRVEAIGRLIENQHRRVGQDRLGQANAALEALRQGLDGLVANFLELQPLDRLFDPARGFRAAEAARTGDEIEEPLHRKFAI